MIVISIKILDLPDPASGIFHTTATNIGHSFLTSLARIPEVAQPLLGTGKLFRPLSGFHILGGQPSQRPKLFDRLACYALAHNFDAGTEFTPSPASYLFLMAE